MTLTNKDFLSALQSLDNIEVSKNKNDKVLIVDALNSYMRAFAATPTMNDDGDHVGGVTGFLRSIAMIIRQTKPTRCVLVFDGRGGSKYRRSLFSEYKNNRKTMQRLNRTYDFSSKDEESDSQKKQLHALLNILSHLPVTTMAVDNVEADDVIAYLSQTIAERDGSSIIVSTDRDFLQLVSENIKVYNPIKKKMYDVDNVIEEFSIHPHNFIIYRVLNGDKTDNVPGVKGVGHASLVKLLPELKNDVQLSWDDVYSLLSNKKSVICERILTSKTLISRNMDLMRLDQQHISGQTKISILDQLDKPIPNLNKYALTKTFVHGKFIGAFGNLDSWLTTTFIPLTRFCE